MSEGKRIGDRFLTNSKYLGVGHCSIGDIEQTDERLVVDLRQRQLDLVVRKGHVAQRPENLGPESPDSDYELSIDYCAILQNHSLSPTEFWTLSVKTACW